MPVHQLGENAESGKAFYVMRFLGKRTLEDAIAEYHERRASLETVAFKTKVLEYVADPDAVKAGRLKRLKEIRKRVQERKQSADDQEGRDAD